MKKNQAAKNYYDILEVSRTSSSGVIRAAYKVLMQKYHPLTVIKWVFLFGLPPVFIIGFNQFQTIDMSLSNTIQQYINTLEFIKQQVFFLSGVGGSQEISAPHI